MKNGERWLGALCIVAVMVLGAFRRDRVDHAAGDVSVSPDLGRAGGPTVMSAFDEGQKAMNAAQAQAAALHLPAGPASDRFDADRTASSLPGGMTLKPVSSQELKDA